MDVVENNEIKSLEHQWFMKAIILFVFRHTDVVSLSDAAIEGNPRCKYIFDGFYWYISEELRGTIWPVCYSLENHIWHYQTPPIEWHMGRSYHLHDLTHIYGIYEDGEPLPEVRQAFEALASRLNGFLNLFRSGVLVAWGQNGQDRALRPVDKRLWSDPHFFFRLSASGASFEELRHRNYEPLFLTLQVRPKGWSPDKKKTGSKKRFDWKAAKQEFLRLQAMPEHKDLHQAGFASLIHDWFAENYEKIPEYKTIEQSYVKKWLKGEG